MTEEEKEAHREKKRYDNYIPPEKRRPPDEWYDLSQLKTAVRIEIVNRDSSTQTITCDDIPSVDPDCIIKYVM